MPVQLPINLQYLLRQRTVEGERIEYKAGWNPDTTPHTICAYANDFANLGGGYVVIGQECDENGQPIFPSCRFGHELAGQELLSLAAKVPFDDRLCQSARAAELSQPLMVEFLREVRSDLAETAPIQTLDQALVHPQLLERELLVKTRHPLLGELRNMGFPAKFDGQAREAERTPPMLGEHSREILREAGYTERQVDEWVEAGVVAAGRRPVESPG